MQGFCLSRKNVRQLLAHGGVLGGEFDTFLCEQAGRLHGDILLDFSMTSKYIVGI